LLLCYSSNIVRWEGYSHEHDCYVPEDDIDKEAENFKEFTKKFVIGCGLENVQFVVDKEKGGLFTHALDRAQQKT
jgi:hypothetical protein